MLLYILLLGELLLFGYRRYGVSYNVPLRIINKNLNSACVPFNSYGYESFLIISRNTLYGWHSHPSMLIHGSTSQYKRVSYHANAAHQGNDRQ